MPSPLITPGPDQGAITGQLIDDRNSQPAAQTAVYLEHSVDHNVPPVLYGPLNNQPLTTTDNHGNFTFNHIPPGEYVLIIYSPMDIWYYQKPDGKAILIEVKPGEVVDLGQIVTYIP